MKEIPVQEIMVPLTSMPSVAATATLGEVAAALAATICVETLAPAVIVLGADGEVAGHVGRCGVLRGIEPKYLDEATFHSMEKWGFSDEQVHRLFADYGLFADPLEHICKNASTRLASEFLTPLGPGSTVPASAGLDRVVHNLVMRCAETVFVEEGGKVVGIVGLNQVFARVAEAMRACAL